MTSRTTDLVRCKCGHEGHIITSENESPRLSRRQVSVSQAWIA